MAVSRCLIIDDNVAFLGASSSLLERQGLSVVGVASTGADGLRLATELAPDLILLDIDLGAENGFTVARQLAAADGATTRKVILISTHPEDDFAELVEQSPVAGFIAKSDLSVEAIERFQNRS
ncbi:MAG: response regulator transcription factor [Solirubrobacterales bacterium]|nr:response regulator transcription factor [Solirubrobacterales bacterium]